MSLKALQNRAAELAGKLDSFAGGRSGHEYWPLIAAEAIAFGNALKKLAAITFEKGD